MCCPNTPFATRLSGSAKETQLRIRSMFQWKKKRPPVWLFAFIVVVIFGCIGLVSLLALKAMGVSKVIVVDIVEKRLQKALELGADVVINGKDEDTVARLMEITDGKGIDLGIETAGSQITASQIIKAAKKGATVVFVGYSPSCGLYDLPWTV